MKKHSDSRVMKDHRRMFLSAVIVIATLILLTVMNARLARQYPDKPPVTDYSVTPVAVPSAVHGWRKFEHPLYKFTFLYPESWKVVLTKTSERDRDYTLVLVYKVEGREYRVDFMRGGRGAPNVDSVRRDTKEYNGRLAYKNTYIKDGVAIEEVITFRDMKTIEPFIAIDAQLPKRKNAEYNKLIDQLAASVKRSR